MKDKFIFWGGAAALILFCIAGITGIGYALWRNFVPDYVELFARHDSWWWYGLIIGLTLAYCGVLLVVLKALISAAFDY